MQAPPVSSISSAYTLNRPVSPAPPILRDETRVLASGMDDPSKAGSIAVRAMRSVRSMARIGGWARSESPTATMGKRLAKSSVKGKELPDAVGSGESWLVGPSSSTGSPTRDAIVSLGTVRPQPERRSSLEKPLPAIRLGSIVSSRKSRLSTSTASSDESVIPRESTSTRTSVDSKRTSTSSRRSSGVGSVMSSAFWAPSSPIPEGDTVDYPTPNAKRDSKSTDGLRRGALANVFDISTSTISTRSPSSTHTRGSESVESYGNPLKSPAIHGDLSMPDPFAAGDVDSYLPQTIRGFSAPPTSMVIPEDEVTKEIRPRPISDQGIHSSLFSLLGEQGAVTGDSTSFNTKHVYRY